MDMPPTYNETTAHDNKAYEQEAKMDTLEIPVFYIENDGNVSDASGDTDEQISIARSVSFTNLHVPTLDGKDGQDDGSSYISAWSEDPKKFGWQLFYDFCHSHRGKHMFKAASAMYAVFVAITAMALILSSTLRTTGNVVDEQTIDYMFTLLYGVSSLCLVFILILGVMKKLTLDKDYKQKRSIMFIMGGILLLGSGGIMYESLILSDYMTKAECMEISTTLRSSSCILFIILEIIFILSFSKVHVNKSFWLEITSMFIIMQVIGTNLATWIGAIVYESEEELHHDKLHPADEDDTLSTTANKHGFENDTCAERNELAHIMAPYAFPLLIEFCVVASSLLIGVWDKVGTRPHHMAFHRCRKISSASQSSMSNPGYSESPPCEAFDFDHVHIDYGDNVSIVAPCYDKHHQNKKYHNNHIGFLVGWLIVIGSIVSIIVYTYAIRSGTGYTEGVEIGVYTVDLTICTISIITIPITIYKMAALTYKDEEIRKLKKTREHKPYEHKHNAMETLDENLLIFTFVALTAFQLLTIISAVELESPIIFAASLSQVVFAFMQTVFLNYFAGHKRAKTEDHLVHKPGRQGLELLRLTNFALWLVNIFLLEDSTAKQVHWETYGTMAWVILSNVTQPLTILFHFHSAICYAEIIAHTYTKKYIGLSRPKRPKRSSIESIEGKDNGSEA